MSEYQMVQPHVAQPPDAVVSRETVIGVSAPTALPLLGIRRQLVLTTYWFTLSFQNGALLGLAVPAQLLGFTHNVDRTWTLGLLGGFVALIGMIVQPIAGALSDLSTGRWGRRRPFLVGGALLDIMGLGIMAVATDLSMLFAGFLLVGFGGSVSGAVYQAYVPDHVPPRQYGEASGYIGAMTMLGTLFSFGAAGFLIAPGHAHRFYLAAIIVVAIGASLTALAIREPDAPRRERPVSTSWRALWLEPWRHSDFVLVFATRALVMVALYALFTFIEYYMRDVVHVTLFVQDAAVVAGVATLAAVAGGLLTGWLSDRVGRKPIVSAASGLMAATLCVMALVHQLSVILGVGIAFGLALGAIASVDWALAIDVLPDRGFTAKDLGLWGISTSLPQTVAPFLGGAVLVALAPFGAATGFAALFLGAALCSAASGILVWRLRNVR